MAAFPSSTPGSRLRARNSDLSLSSCLLQLHLHPILNYTVEEIASQISSPFFPPILLLYQVIFTPQTTWSKVLASKRPVLIVLFHIRTPYIRRNQESIFKSPLSPGSGSPCLDGREANSVSSLGCCVVHSPLTHQTDSASIDSPQTIHSPQSTVIIHHLQSLPSTTKLV